MSYEIEVRHQLEPFFGEPRIWDALSAGIALRETAWLAPWWRHLAVGRQAYLIVARKPSGQICGLLPLYRKSTGGHRTLGILGDGNTCTDYVSVLSRPDEARQVGEAIGKFLATIAGDSQYGWDALEIDGIVEGDVAMTSLAKGLKALGAPLHTVSRMRTWFCPTTDSWDEHLKRYGKTERRKMRRIVEQLSADADFEVRVASTEADVEEMFASLVDMHQRRWQSVGEPGSYASDDFRHFAIDAAKEFLKRGRLYLNLLRHQGRDLAAEFSIIGENRVMYHYSSGYEIDAAELEPGRKIRVDTLHQLYQSDLAGIDFMRGDETYKQRLASTSRRVLCLRASAPAIMPRLRHAAWCTGFEIKQWVRKQSGKPLVETFDLTLPAYCPPR